MIHGNRCSAGRAWHVAALLLVPALGGPARAGEGVSISIVPAGDRVRVRIDGRLFAEYHYHNVSRPFLYPIIGPDGLRMTRSWPIEEAENEDRDHPHHRSLWYSHGDVNGHDFWSESARAGKTVHVEFTRLESGPNAGIIQSRNKLVARDGTVVCTDERTLRFHAGGQLLDFDITIHASEGDVVFGDTKEGTLAIRLAETMRLRPNKFISGKPTGHIVNSEGARDGQTWGKRARWVDYYGPVNGQIAGVAIFDHPQNPRHPTWWHVRDYGLFAANPFGIHDFERKPAGTGDLKVPAGQSIAFRHRFYFHRGDAETAEVAKRYAEYIAAVHP